MLDPQALREPPALVPQEQLDQQAQLVIQVAQPVLQALQEQQALQAQQGQLETLAPQEQPAQLGQLAQ
jgi:hypothetical protein